MGRSILEVLSMDETFTFEQLAMQFSTEDGCLAYLIHARWADGKFVCQNCQSQKSSAVRNRRHFLQCDSCRKQYSPTSGTIFHGSRVPLTKLFQMLLRMVAKDISSAAQTARELEMHYSTTWEWMRRFRSLMGHLGSITQISVHFSYLSQVLFRRSTENADTELDNHNEENDDHEAAYEQCDLASETLASAITSAKRLISAVFHGVSRKYIQIYLAELAFHRQKDNLFEMLFESCTKHAPITRQMILDYVSPKFILIPLA